MAILAPMKFYLLLLAPFLLFGCKKEKEEFYVTAEFNGTTKRTADITYIVIPQTEELSVFNARFGNIDLGIKLDQNLPTFEPGDYTFRPQPANLVFFNIEGVNGMPKLVWTTASETNMQSFVIEKSADAVNFAPIASVAATNTQTAANYNYTDSVYTIGRLYYRIKMVEQNNSAAYSQVRIFSNQGSYIGYYEEDGIVYRGFNGLVKIISHNRTSHIIEGSFSFDIRKNSGQIVQVRNGAFRIKY